MLSFVRTGAVVAGVALAGLVAAPAVATGKDDPGNNGTVKIEGLDFDAIPNNAPHQGCTFNVEWYGFDETAESTVTFELQKPTAGDGYDLEVEGKSPVDVGGDGGSGAGTETGFDARETYTLTPTGGAHAKQGEKVLSHLRAAGAHRHQLQGKGRRSTHPNQPRSDEDRHLRARRAAGRRRPRPRR